MVYQFSVRKVKRSRLLDVKTAGRIPVVTLLIHMSEQYIGVTTTQLVIVNSSFYVGIYLGCGENEN